MRMSAAGSRETTETALGAAVLEAAVHDAAVHRAAVHRAVVAGPRTIRDANPEGEP